MQFVTWSGYQRAMSVVAVTNDDDCPPVIASFLQSMELRAPDPGNAPAVAAPTTSPAAPAAPGRFKFTTTNFDDGWVATQQPDWAQASKGDVTVLIHYTPEDKPNLANVDETTAYFWKKLVAPRYRQDRGHPVGFSAALAGELLALSGDQGARALLEKHRTALRLIDCDDAGVLYDIDRKSDVNPSLG